MADGNQRRSAVPRAGRSGGPGPGRSRRHLLRGLFTLGVVTGTSAALAPILRAGPSAPAAPARADGPDAALDEMYRGRRIQIGPRRPGRTSDGAPAAVPAGHDGGQAVPAVLIDGRPLHLMRRADGGYLSAVNHYQSFPTAIETARAAVDELRGARLRPGGPLHHI
ncbi:tyrosinase family oxidase copper chaperone [Streptomyces corynorhini]|uniref:Tyrosinase n=1 Tax=Streptomyces corynorhini TaxID=2282652 RepID=A0A370BEW9_9ACTN|nr:tyrosinase family oxidase copper chaperone [Streptomyces corynorhini]RDG38363.1 tyrosinase [Streptomyces corynorhini]